MEYNNKVEHLINVLAQQSYSGETKPFRKWIMQWVRENVPGYKMKVTDGNLYVTRGEPTSGYYPCVVSHTDTVHKMNPHAVVLEHDGYLFAWDNKKKQQYGIGGDDKVGVFICLMMLAELPAMKCAFFRDEEVGCKGSALANKDFFKDCSFVLQCDRRGNSDFVDEISGLPMHSKEFADAVRPALNDHGYKPTHGMMTDVEKLKDIGVHLCMANMSCGYYSPHSDEEVVCIDDVMNCLSMVHQICVEQSYTQWYHIGTRPVYKPAVSYLKNKRWTHQDIHWIRMVPAVNGHYGFYVLTELKETKLNRDQMMKETTINGIGTWESPFRLKNADDDYWAKKSTTIPVVAADEPIIPDCPTCQTGFGSMWDVMEGDYYCTYCMNYHGKIKDWYNHYNKLRSLPTSSSTDLPEPKDGKYPSTEMIDQQSERLSINLKTGEESKSTNKFF